MNRQNFRLPRLAITIGDPAGIGPEVVLKALTDTEIGRDCQITLIGSRSILESLYPLNIAASNLSVIDINRDLENITPGHGNAITGELSFLYLQEAIKLTLEGRFDAIITAPIAKYCWQAAGYDFPGQTEVLARGAGVEKYGMLFVATSPRTGWTLRTLLATTHIPLEAVPRLLTPELMDIKLELLIHCLNNDFGIGEPTIAISGLNPHSGEGGHIGNEEKEWLEGWLERARQKFPRVKLLGPVPPDTLWVDAGRAWFDGSGHPADGYLALYHDQGLIPVKLMAFDRAINTTIGLPFIRTSPDHGTAFDIAGKNIANPESMKAAISLAAHLARKRLSCS